MAIILASLLAALALALALHAGVRCLLRRRRQRQRQGRGVDGAAEGDPEKPAVAEPAPPPPLPPLLVYSASGTRLAGAAAHECAICLAEFAEGDAVRAMPACGHGFHARCIERWLAVPATPPARPDARQRQRPP